MLELWQTEWCPASRRVRQRLTELGIDYLIRQVPVEKEQRAALQRATGSDVIPAVICEDGAIATGEDAIMRLFDQRISAPDEAEAHRLKAAKARRRYLEEECECLQPATR
jgi:glutathione S-transferase